MIGTDMIRFHHKNMYTIIIILYYNYDIIILLYYHHYMAKAI